MSDVLNFDQKTKGRDKRNCTHFYVTNRMTNLIYPLECCAVLGTNKNKTHLQLPINLFACIKYKTLNFIVHKNSKQTKRCVQQAANQR